jgi:hypothetical protein
MPVYPVIQLSNKIGLAGRPSIYWSIVRPSVRLRHSKSRRLSYITKQILIHSVVIQQHS